MATDIKISELNEITANDDINYIIVNDRENAGDEGITKKITLENFLTPNIVQETNILNSAVTNDKIQDLAVDCSKIASNTITCNQILGCTINNPSLDSNSVDNRVLNNNCNFTVKGLLVNDGCVHISNPATGSLNVASGVTRLNGLNYNWPSSQVPDKFLKTDGAGNLTWQEAVPGESTALVFAEIMPVGTIIPWGGIEDIPDDKWLPCNGGSFNGATYPELSAAIGENFGSRISDQFKLPDMRGRVPLGEATSPGNSDGTDTCTFLLGVKGGKYNHQLNITEMPSHNHCVNMTNDAQELPTNNYCRLAPGQGIRQTSGINVQIQSTGGDTSHNNIQPYMVTRYIIKARPDDIEQFNPVITPGLSAKNAGGQQANITLNTTEIGLKVTDDFQFDTGGKLELSIPPSVVKRKRVEYSVQKSTTVNDGGWGSDDLPIAADLDLLMATDFTSTTTNNKLHIKFEGLISNHNSGRGVKLALFEGTTCVGATPYLQPSAGNALTNVSFEFTPTAGNQTYQLRWGVSGGTGYVNRWGTYSPDYGGLVKSYLTIEEVSGTTYEVYTDPA